MAGSKIKNACYIDTPNCNCYKIYLYVQEPRYRLMAVVLLTGFYYCLVSLNKFALFFITTMIYLEKDQLPYSSIISQEKINWIQIEKASRCLPRQLQCYE